MPTKITIRVRESYVIIETAVDSIVVSQSNLRELGNTILKVADRYDRLAVIVEIKEEGE